MSERGLLRRAMPLLNYALDVPAMERETQQLMNDIRAYLAAPDHAAPPYIPDVRLCGVCEGDWTLKPDCDDNLCPHRSVSPQATTAALVAAAPSSEGVGQGGTAEGADWVRVPREPTEEMLEAGWTAQDKAEDLYDLARAYKAMLSAAPRPDAQNAAPQVSLTRKGAIGTVDADSHKVEPATSPFSTPAVAAPRPDAGEGLVDAQRVADERDRIWTLAISYALGVGSGFKVPLLPNTILFTELFKEIRDREAARALGRGEDMSGPRQDFERAIYKSNPPGDES